MILIAFLLSALLPTANAINSGNVVSVDSFIGRNTAAIFVRTEQPKPTICSGVLVARKLVLTAAHCLDLHEVKSIEVKFVGHEPVRGGVYFIAPNRSAVHRVLQPPTDSFDIAVIRLDQSAPKELEPAVLEKEMPAPFPGEKMIVAGGGCNTPTTEIADGVVRQGIEEFANSRGFTEAEFRSGKTLGTCRSDSGGPVFQIFPGKIRLYAISKAGTADCQGTSHKTLVSPYVSWLQSLIAKFGN